MKLSFKAEPCSHTAPEALTGGEKLSNLNKHNMTKIKNMLLAALLLLTAYTLPAQKVRLLDLNSQAPIQEASYKYGDLQGITASDGSFTLEIKKGLSLSLSHLNYGSWELKPDEVQHALKTGVIFRQETNYMLQPVTIVAVHTPASGNPVHTIGTADRLAHDGGNLLNNIEGFSSIRKSPAYGYDPVFRGFKYDQLNVVIDGSQCASAACPNRMDPPTSQVAPNMTGRIEILKGPHSLRFGNSFGATINFITTPPVFTETLKTTGRLTSSFESNGGILRNEGTITLSRKNATLSLFGSYSKGGDYKDGSGNKVPADFMRASAGAVVGFRLTSSQTLELSATRNFARDTDFPALMMDLRSDDTWLLNLRHTANLNRNNLKSWKTTAYASLVDHVMDNLDKVMNPRMMNALTPAKTKTYGGRTEGSWLFEGSRLFAGLDIKHDYAEGIREREFIAGPNAGKVFYDNIWQKGNITRSALFAEYQRKLNKLSLIASARLEANQSSTDETAPEFAKNYTETTASQINPSFSVGVIANPGSKFTAGLWLGRSQRSGSMTERFINYLAVGQDAWELLGNPLIKPEANNEADLNLAFSTGKTEIRLDMFAALITDYISSVIDTSLTPKFTTSPGVRQFINIDKAFKTGFEVSWIQSLGSFMKHRLSIAYTYGQNSVTDEPLPEISPLDMKYVLSANLLKDRLTPVVSFRYAADQNRISTDYGETKTPSFFLIDVSASYRIVRGIDLTAGIQNLLDEAYYEHLNRTISGMPPVEIFAPGRSIFVSLSFALK